MKKFLIVLGAVFLGIITLFVGLAIWAGLQIGPANEEAKQYARETTLAIAASWNSEAVYERASDELLETLNPGDVDRLVGQGARLVGDLDSLGDFSCATNVSAHSSTGKVITATCTAQGVHQRGHVDYKLIVIKRDEAWALNLFNFNAEPSEDMPTEV